MTLTPRQREVTRLIAEGKTVFQVADELGIRPATVRTHLTQIYMRLGVHNRIQLLKWWLGEGARDE